MALPSLAPQTTHAAREKAVVLAALPSGSIPLSTHVRGAPTGTGAGEAAAPPQQDTDAHQGSAESPWRKKCHRGLPRTERASEPLPPVTHLLRARAEPLAPAHPHRALFSTSPNGTRQRSAVTPVSQGGDSKAERRNGFNSTPVAEQKLNLVLFIPS